MIMTDSIVAYITFMFHSGSVFYRSCFEELLNQVRRSMLQ